MSPDVGEDSFQRLHRGRTFHVEVNGVPVGEFVSKRTRDFSCSSRGEDQLEIFSGRTTGEPALVKLGEKATPPTWRGPGGEGTGWEEFTDQVPGYYAVRVYDPLGQGGDRLVTFGIYLGP